MKWRLGFLTTVLALGSTALLAAPAQAATPALSVADAPYVAGGCTTPAYVYDAAPPAGYTDVSVTLAVISADYDIPFIITRDGATGSGTFNLCNVAAGPYQATMDVFACTFTASSCVSYEGPEVTFYVGPRPVPPPPLAALTIKPKLSVSDKTVKADQVVTFKLRVKFSRKPETPTTATLYAKKDGAWRKVKGSVQKVNGTSAKWSYRVSGDRVQVRAVVKAEGDQATTKPVTLT